MSDSDLPPLFRGLEDEKLDKVLACFSALEVKAGQPLVREGEPGSQLVYILSGRLQVRTGSVQLEVCGPQDIIGEAALFSEGMRTATVIAVEASELLLLDHDGYTELRARHPPVARRLERNILEGQVRRLRAVDQRIAQGARGRDLGAVLSGDSLMERLTTLFGAGRASPAMAPIDKENALGLVPAFEGASKGALRALAEMMQSEGFHSGDLIFVEGDPGDSMYVLVKGDVEVVVTTGGDKVEPVATLKHGEMLGQGALLDNAPRMASCIARGDTVVLKLERQAWQDIVRSNTQAGSALRVALIRVFHDQLAFANGQLVLAALQGRDPGLEVTAMSSARARAWEHATLTQE